MTITATNNATADMAKAVTFKVLPGDVLKSVEILDCLSERQLTMIREVSTSAQDRVLAYREYARRGESNSAASAHYAVDYVLETIGLDNIPAGDSTVREAVWLYASSIGKGNGYRPTLAMKEQQGVADMYDRLMGSAGCAKRAYRGAFEKVA